MLIDTDVLIVGSGVAGMYCALNLDSNLNIVIVTKGKVRECNSYLAQGGISTARDIDDEKQYIEDTLKAGEYKNDISAVKVLVSESRENIKELEKLGVNFDKDGTDYSYTREGAHSNNRIVHCTDQTGKEVIEALYSKLKKRKNIKLYEDTCLVDIISKNNTCYGGIFIKENNVLNIHAKETVLATGGIGGLFKNSTNERMLTGNGIAIGIKHNIELKDMEYIQFHPTALYEEKQDTKRFLISEAVRGEGAKLLNINGNRYIDELLPRNVVSKATLEEEKNTNSKFVYLDLSNMSKDFIKRRFPGIYNGCLERGLDITENLIPVTPVQHYFMGGIKVNLNSKTSMKKLYACGEVSCTGVHGANRLASNSLLESLVFSKRAAKCINLDIHNNNYSNFENFKFNIDYKKALDENMLNNKLVLTEMIKVRGDIKDELLNY